MNGLGAAVKRREDTHKMAEATRPSATSSGSHRRCGERRPGEAPTEVTSRHDIPLATDAQHRDHRPHRRRQDHRHRAHPLLHRARSTDRRGRTRARPRWTGWPQEQERGITITAAATTCVLERPRINIIDTPGPRRLHRRGRALAARARRRRRRLRRRGRRGAAVRDGLAPGRPLQRAAHLLRQQDGPHRRRLLGASTRSRTASARNAVPSSCRSAREDNFQGVDRPGRDEGRSARRRPRRADATRARSRPSSGTQAEKYRDEMIEAVAEFDDDLIDEVPRGRGAHRGGDPRRLRAGTLADKVIPVLCGRRFKNKGVQPLLDAVVDYLPSRSTCRRSSASTRHGDEELRARRRRRRAVRGAGLQDHDRPVRRQAGLLPGLLGHAQGGLGRLQPRPRARRSASAASSRCTPTTARTIDAGLRGRHRRRRRPEGHRHRRHAVRPEHPSCSSR